MEFGVISHLLVGFTAGFGLVPGLCEVCRAEIGGVPSASPCSPKIPFQEGALAAAQSLVSLWWHCSCGHAKLTAQTSFM